MGKTPDAGSRGPAVQKHPHVRGEDVTVPEDLREAHATLDDIVDSCYPGYPFANDEARLECLFKLYEKITKKKD